MDSSTKNEMEQKQILRTWRGQYYVRKAVGSNMKIIGLLDQQIV